MKPETIKVIFTNIIFVIGVILLVIGFTRGTLTVGRLIVFDKYPLNSFEETRCEKGVGPRAVPLVEKEVVELSTEEVAVEKESCLSALERERDIKKFDDLVGSFSFFIAGAALTYTFRKFILK